MNNYEEMQFFFTMKVLTSSRLLSNTARESMLAEALRKICLHGIMFSTIEHLFNTNS